MDEKELHDRGLKLRVEMFGREAVEKRMSAFGEFGKPLQHIINAYAYGDVWSRSALPPATKSLAMVAMMAAIGQPNELRVHLKGALKNGSSVEQIQEILLLLGDVSRHSGRERRAPHRGRSPARARQALNSGELRKAAVIAGRDPSTTGGANDWRRLDESARASTP